MAHIGELQQIRRTNKPDIYKQTIDLVSETGETMYAEIRNSGLKILDREGIEVGSIVNIELEFQGTEKFGKKYNNLILTKNNT